MKRSGAAPTPALLKSPEPSIRWKTRVRVLGEDEFNAAKGRVLGTTV